MRSFRDYSIKRKLMVITLMTSGAALLAASIALIAYELITFRGTLTRNRYTLAQIIGTNSMAALTFNDPAAAQETLSALSAVRDIVWARIYTPEGEVFARFLSPVAKAADPPFGELPTKEPVIQNGSLTLCHSISSDHEVIGTVCIESNLEELRARLERYIEIAVMVIFASFFVAFFLSSKLQGMISKPILKLAEAAKIISQEKNYSIRVAKESRDELGTLMDGFNEMLMQIQARDASLQNARDDLERRVKERTKELQQEILERRKAEDEVRTLNEDLEGRVVERTAQLTAANKEMEAFSYSVSHDLRAPLRSIDGFSQVLLEDYGDKIGPKGKDHLQRVRAACRRMGQLIDDMLNLSRLTRSEMHLASVNLSELSKNVVNDLKQNQPDRKVTVVIQEGLTANGDERLLRVLLENLLGNAWKFTSKKDVSKIEFGKTDQEGHPVYFVRDNGAGFDMAYADKLFGAFQRLHGANEFEGTGVGLVTAQRIIHRHNGRIWAEASVGQGAAFYFTL